MTPNIDDAKARLRELAFSIEVQDGCASPRDAADIRAVLAELERLQAAERQREDFDNSFCKECERHTGTVLEEKHCDQWPEDSDSTCRCCEKCRVRCREIPAKFDRIKTKSGHRLVRKPEQP